jgi:hypothetical protein
MWVIVLWRQRVKPLLSGVKNIDAILGHARPWGNEILGDKPVLTGVMESMV